MLADEIKKLILTGQNDFSLFTQNIVFVANVSVLFSVLLCWCELSLFRSLLVFKMHRPQLVDYFISAI